MYKFDYNDFKKELKFSTNIPIDRAGLSLKPDSTAFIEDSDSGEVYEVDMNEISDEYVNLVFAPIDGANIPAYQVMNTTDTSPIYLWGESINEDPAKNLVWGDLEPSTLHLDWGEDNLQPPTLYSLGVGENNIQTEYTIPILPRHQLMQDDYSNEEYRSVQIDREIYAALGLWPNNNYTINLINGRNDLGTSDSYAKGFISKAEFQKRLTELRDLLEPHNIAIRAPKYYEEKKIEDNGNFIDVNASGISNYGNFQQSQIQGMGCERYKRTIENTECSNITGFINRKILGVSPDGQTGIEQPEIDLLPRENGEVSPFTVSIKQIVKAQFDKNDLTTELSETLQYIINNLDKPPNNNSSIKKIVEDAGELIDLLTSNDEQYLDKLKDLRISIKKINIDNTFTFGAIFDVINLARFDDVVKKIIWYERYTNESVFPNKTFISGDEIRTFKKADKMIARVLIPVHLGTKKVKTLKKTWYRWKRKYKRINLGVRWVLVEFINTSVFEQYRTNEMPSGDKIENLKIPVMASIDNNNTVVLTSTTDFFDEADLIDKIVVGITVTGATKEYRKYNGTFTARMLDKYKIVYDLNGDDDLSGVPTGDIIISRIITKFSPTTKDETPEQVNISFKMPNLPSNDAMRKKAFSMFGQFEQNDVGNRVEDPGYLPITVTDNMGKSVRTNDVPSGYQLFYDSSKTISDMRKGIDIYNKVQFLFHILQAEFNHTRVKIIETIRSLEGQDKLQMGSLESNFLSWHNFGLAIKILITEQGGTELIKRNTPDFYKLMDIAEAFIKGCQEGKFGTPVNLVWCEQLVLGADMFVWEFLPIGVDHRSAWKFRQAAYNQQDPVVANAYVNVTEKGYVINDDDPVPNTPYIRKGSIAYQTAIVVDGKRWVHPSTINNYNTPSNLVLTDLQEFLYLIENKFNAHGTELLSDLLVTQWKQQNPISFDQLMMYNALLGNFPVTTALLAIDYIDTRKILINSLARTNSIEFVKQFLGDEYENIKITLQNAPDGSFISLHNGKITISLADTRSTHPSGSGNIFGERQVDENTIELGYYDTDGKFNTENSIPTIESSNSVIDGYNENNEPIDGDAEFLHTLIKSQILKEVDRIRSLYENLNTKFLYDDLLNSPNKNLKDTLENEFGIIVTQTILSIPVIRDMYTKININDGPVISIGGTEGASNHSVYEKLISNAQLAGVQKADITKEKPVIEPLQNNVTVEKIMRFIENKHTDVPDVRDIL